ncbi:MAG: Stk1 family PASTA domain-containing Ser/Thr kinase [Lachnospiraceae bacterium]|nr:Stk1 family PASTA domain-containing Ser/Thr kinase [Lachnospiraceae bacterium]
MMLRPGVFLQDRYEILEQIGSGGMSVVYKAKCHKLNRLVAIKVLKEEFSSDSTFVGKFKMEAQAAAGLSHPNIVSVYDVIDEGKLHYIVMELIEGITLKTYIGRKGRLEIKESIGIAIQVSQGIGAAHEQHIIHRDIKPQNMLISKDGKVKVADFGIARAVSAQTMSSSAMGSVHYISPEQARGALSDERSDIYSLGITMYEMVTGKLPFEGDNTVAIALAHLENVVVPPSVYNPEIPVALERIILQCVEKKPENRYRNVNEVTAGLMNILIQTDGGGKGARELEIPIGTGKKMNDHTREISPKELAQINGRIPRRVDIPDNGRRPAIETAATRKPAAREDYEYSGRRKGWMDEDLEDEEPEEDLSGVHPQIERILAVAGVVVAIIIVAVLVVVFSRLGGLFQAGTGLWGKETSAQTQAFAEDVPDTTSGESLDDTQVRMPRVLGLPVEEAEKQLKENYLKVQYDYENSDDVKEGDIIRQNPEPGEAVSRWSAVTVVVSNGTDKIDVSGMGIEGLEVATAKKYLENWKLLVDVVEEEHDTVEAGKVIRYEINNPDPAHPNLVPEGGLVRLFVSKGPHVELVPVPAITGKEEAEAIAMLGEAGLIPGNTSTQHDASVPKGYIISQSGGTDGMIEPGGAIDYVISLGPEVRKQRYVASIDTVYDLSNLIGPGANSASFTVMVRLHQVTNGQDEYKTLTEPRTITGDILLPISYTSIESMNGTDEGEVEVVDATSGAVLKAYPLTFFPMD